MLPIPSESFSFPKTQIVTRNIVIVSQTIIMVKCFTVPEAIKVGGGWGWVGVWGRCRRLTNSDRMQSA